MTIATDITAVTTAITTATTAANLISDANTKAAALDMIAVLTDIATTLTAISAAQVTDEANIAANTAAIAANPYVTISESGGILPNPPDTDPTAGTPDLDLSTYISVPGRISSAATQNNALLNFNVESFTLGAATKNSAYTDTSMAANGGSGEGFTFAVVDTTLLPPGITMASNGHFSGTPTVDGTFQFAVTVVDSAGDSVSAAFEIVVTG